MLLETPDSIERGLKIKRRQICIGPISHPAACLPKTCFEGKHYGFLNHPSKM